MNIPQNAPPPASTNEKSALFHFSNANTDFYYILAANVHLHIKRTNAGIATIYFTDQFNNKINIPKSILVYTYDHSRKVQIIVPHLCEEYLLSWTDDYVIMNNNDILITIANQRTWEIKTFDVL